MERVTHNDKKVKNRAAVGRIERQIVEFLASGINGVNVDDVVNAVNNNCDYGGEIIIWVDVYLKLKKDLLGKWPKGLIYKVAHHQLDPIFKEAKIMQDYDDILNEDIIKYATINDKPEFQLKIRDLNILDYVVGGKYV